MTSHLVTRFSCAFIISALSAGAGNAGAVSGLISIANSHISKTHERVFDGAPVIWLEPAGTQAPIVPRHVTMTQKDKRFSPHELVVEVGSTVDFPNLDPIFHNAFSSFDGQIFDIGLYPPGKSRSIQFHRAGVVRVFCNIHPTMAAVILVLNTPYWTPAANDGSYALPDIPAGTYRLHVFDEKASPESLSALSQNVIVAGGQIQVPAISISESEYLARPHKNKYGKDYPATNEHEYGLPE